MRIKLLLTMLIFLGTILGLSVLIGTMETETSYAKKDLIESTLIYNNFDLTIR